MSLKSSLTLMVIQEQLRAALDLTKAALSNVNTLDEAPPLVREGLAQTNQWLAVMDGIISLHVDRRNAPESIPTPVVASPPSIEDTEHPPLTKAGLTLLWAQKGLPIEELEQMLGRHRPTHAALQAAARRLEEITDSNEGSTSP